MQPLRFKSLTLFRQHGEISVEYIVWNIHRKIDTRGDGMKRKKTGGFAEFYTVKEEEEEEVKFNLSLWLSGGFFSK